MILTECINLLFFKFKTFKTFYHRCKANAEELHKKMKHEGHDVSLLHGDMNQFDRNKVIGEFKKQQASGLQ